jgi:hypothetical protein
MSYLYTCEQGSIECLISLKKAIQIMLGIGNVDSYSAHHDIDSPSKPILAHAAPWPTVV